MCDPMVKWRALWEETSYQLEKLQCNSACVESERNILEKYVKAPAKWSASLLEGLVPRPIIGQLVQKLDLRLEQQTFATF